MRRSKYIFFMLLPFLWACNESQWKTTASGLKYRIVSSGSGTPVNMGSTVKIYLHRTFHDSIVFTNAGKPQYIQLVPGIISPYSADEALLSGIHEGDSLQIIQRGDSLLAKGILKKLRSGTKPSDEWITGIRVAKVFSFDALHTLVTDSLIAVDEARESGRGSKN